jgi:hypothetical protein
VRTRLATAAVAVAILTPLTMAAAHATPTTSPAPAPYVDPPFHCTVHHYGNGKAPNPLKTKADPLCVDYNKRDITVDNGGVARFLAAEPARFAVAGKCQYWQQDHWRVRVDRGFGAIVRWDGSYWFDVTDGSGAAILRHFQIAGQPVGPTQAAAAVQAVSPALAKEIRVYGAGRSGGGGASVTLPSGMTCSAPTP